MTLGSEEGVASNLGEAAEVIGDKQQDAAVRASIEEILGSSGPDCLGFVAVQYPEFQNLFHIVWGDRDCSKQDNIAHLAHIETEPAWI